MTEFLTPKRLRIFAPIFLTLFSLLLMGTGANMALAQNPTPTPPGQVQLPTATATIVGGPTATATRTPTLVPVLAEAIDEANVRSGPGLDFEIVGQITFGNPVPIIGRSVSFPWYQLEWADGEAWVFDQLVLVRGDITTVPIVGEPELPTVDPTQAAIQATATILIQTPGAAETASATAFFAPTGVFTATPGGVAVAEGGVLPTFTAPPPYNQPTILAPAGGESTGGRGGITPAVIIFTLGAFGLLMVVVGLVRRVF